MNYEKGFASLEKKLQRIQDKHALDKLDGLRWNFCTSQKERSIDLSELIKELHILGLRTVGVSFTSLCEENDTGLYSIKAKRLNSLMVILSLSLATIFIIVLGTAIASSKAQVLPPFAPGHEQSPGRHEGKENNTAG